MALGLHGAALLAFLRPGTPQQWVAVGLVGISGLIGLVLGDRITTGFQTALIAVAAAWLILDTGGADSFFLLWLFVLAAVYPAVLPRPLGYALSVAVAAFYGTIPLYRPSDLPPVVIASRSFLLAAIGLIVAGMAVALENLVRAREELIASVSHELRTPLTAVVGFTRLLQEHGPRMPEEERAELIASVAEQASDLADIVEDLLISARAEAGTLRVERRPVDLRAEAGQVATALALESAAPIEVGDDGVKALGDPARIRQILRNLVTNAVRYGGDRIRIDFYHRDGLARVAVSDDGPGIPIGQADRIFDSYQRAHDSPGVTPSLGLGLTISRRLARLMGGDLTYRREEGWSVFELALPAAQGEDADR